MCVCERERVCVCVCVRERERERERQRERQKERQRDRETERETERERGENTAWQESRGACTAKGAERLIPSLAPSIIFFMKRRSSSDSAVAEHCLRQRNSG